MSSTGGSYIKRPGEPPELIQATADHPEGNRARNEAGEPVGSADEVVPYAPDLTPESGEPS